MKAELDTLYKRIHKAAEVAGRDPADIRLVAVSKTKPAEMIREAVAAGVTIIGESYVQEARDKYAILQDLPVSWHFIGHLQTNKVKYVIRICDLIHSVDSFKLAAEINRQAEKAGKIQQILVQVNIAEETTKSGITTEGVVDLIKGIAGLEHVRMQGLMTIPPFFDDPEKARPFFKTLRLLRDEIRQLGVPGVELDDLSMGMTGDFEAAIAEGATFIRVGTALFGERK